MTRRILAALVNAACLPLVWLLDATANRPTLADDDETCGCHPDWHELGVHEPGHDGGTR